MHQCRPLKAPISPRALEEGRGKGMPREEIKTSGGGGGGGERDI